MSTSDEDITRRYRARKTVMEMLHDRGFIASDLELNMTKEQFVEIYGENWKHKDTIHTAKRDNSSDQIVVFFNEKINIDALKEKVEQLRSAGVFRAIFVVREFVTPVAKIAMRRSAEIHMEHFQETELLVNVTNHYLVPKHMLLTDEEKKTLLQKYDVTESKLPRIQATDPVARYYGLKRGQVVKIIRPSETAGKYVTYRCVT